jgi:hypothetical protein
MISMINVTENSSHSSFHSYLLDANIHLTNTSQSHSYFWSPSQTNPASRPYSTYMSNNDLGESILSLWYLFHFKTIWFFKGQVIKMVLKHMQF